MYVVEVMSQGLVRTELRSQKMVALLFTGVGKSAWVQFSLRQVILRPLLCHLAYLPVQ